ncbi:transmembrane amino acid transporter protein domain-containing protein [Phthorimaea operculella]|nr:transmembrane amino acid transporter protein domain-containing protein [Phthorimaea operculella]
MGNFINKLFKKKGQGADAAPTDPNAPKVETETRKIFTLKSLGEEALHYDFITPRGTENKTTVVQSVGHLIKSCLGGGVVAIHASYAKCGLWLALFLNISLGFLVAYLMIVLAKSAQRVYGRAQVNSLSYPELAEATFQISKYERVKKRSRCFRYCVDATIMIDLFGSCCCYMCLIAEQMQQLIQYYAKTDIPLRAYIAMLLIPCILICMILTLKYLAPFSIVADIVIVIVAVCTIVYGSKHAKQENRKPQDMEFTKGNVPLIFQFMGGCVFSMEGVGVTMPIENNMKDPRKITKVLTIGMSVVISIVMTVGFFGYWGWADKSQAPVTKNFPYNWITLILKIALPLMVYVTFALNFWVPFNLAWVYLKHRHAKMDMKKKERMYRVIFVFVICMVSVAFPQVVDLMGVIGAFCLSNMGFLYPATIQLLLDLEEPGLGRKKLDLPKTRDDEVVQKYEELVRDEVATWDVDAPIEEEWGKVKKLLTEVAGTAFGHQKAKTRTGSLKISNTLHLCSSPNDKLR